MTANPIAVANIHPEATWNWKRILDKLTQSYGVYLCTKYRLNLIEYR